MNKRLFFSALIIFLIVIPAIFLFFMQKKNPSPSPSFFPTPTTIANPPQNGPLGITIQNTTPQNNSDNVGLNQNIVIILNKPATLDQIAINISPNVPYTASIKGNNLIISPQTPLQPGTTYSYMVKYADSTTSDRYSFTTVGEQPSSAVSPTPVDNVPEMELEWQRVHQPDLFLSNKTPFETQDFSVTNDYTSTPTEHFYFTVTSKTPNGRQAFLNWLTSLNLGNQQIQQLDIRYQ